MSAKWDLHLALLLMCLLKATRSLPTTSRPLEFSLLEAVSLQGSATEGFIFATEDYDGLDYSVTPSVPLLQTSGGRCDYKPCLENQISCYELSISTRCLCPGLTLNNVPPEAPALGLVRSNGSEVIVEWCEPLSYVTHYVVTVGGQDTYIFGKDKRSGSVGQVDNVVQVCVSAVNDAGEGEASCVMYQPTEGNVPLIAGLIGGALVLLAVLLLVVLVLRRRQKQQEAHVSSAH